MADVSPSQLSLIESLKSLGLTKYEALVYIGLLKVTGATATEIHEISGVPRASVYPVLDRLIQRNLVAVSHTTPRRFNALNPEEGIDHLMQSVKSDAARARRMLGEIYRDRSKGEKGDQELIWSIYTDENIRFRLFDMLNQAESRIQIIFLGSYLKNEIIHLLREREGQVDIEVMTDHWEGPHPAGMKVYVKKPGHPPRSPAVLLAGGVFLVDGTRAMVVMISGEEGSTALFSESKGFVKFFTMYWNLLSELTKIIP